MIEIRNVTKKYGNKLAVDNLSFEVNEGEILGFLGPNGAGKSTTMNILTGYLSATSGSAMIDGVDIFENPVKAKRLIGFLPEIPPLYPEMTVKEFLNFVYELKDCRFPREQHLKEICEVVKITDVYKRMIKNLSKGYRQRVGIAQALIGNPKVIIFDEPTIGLDPKQIIEIRNLIKQLGKDHTVILSTHILPEVQAVCDRIVVINKGKLVANQRTEDLILAVEGARKMIAKIVGPEPEVLKTLKTTAGVKFAEVIGKRDTDSISYMLESEENVDMRKSVFFAMARNNWPIIGFEGLELSLEDIFIRLTESDKSDKEKAKRRKGVRKQ